MRVRLARFGSWSLRLVCVRSCDLKEVCGGAIFAIDVSALQTLRCKPVNCPVLGRQRQKWT